MCGADPQGSESPCQSVLGVPWSGMADLATENPGNLWALFLGNAGGRGEGAVRVQLIFTRPPAAMPHSVASDNREPRDQIHSQ